MDQSFASQIVSGLKALYDFRKVGGSWLQEGRCPDCGKRELFAAANDPKVVRCGRSNNCGFEISVRQALPDLFENWSDRFEQTEQDPNAAADAYLRIERGLDLAGLRGHFSQEVIRQGGEVSATVRFPLPGDSWWERIIDRPGRFRKKANFKFGGSWGGHCWAHPEDGFENLAGMDEVWIAEGIFDALALRQNFLRIEKAGAPMRRSAVSAMSVNVWPEHFLAALIEAVGPKGKRPDLVFAFDVGAAGASFTRKFVRRANDQGWNAFAAQVRPDAEGSKLDWNDLHLRHTDWKGDPEKAPFAPQMLEEYRYNGDLLTAESPTAKARLIHERHSWASFYFRFDNRIYWSSSKADEDGGSRLDTSEVANCSFRILYRERDEELDETNYFLDVRFPGRMPPAKARFSAACCAANGDFKKRLFAFSGMWAGNQQQLDRIMRDQTRELKTVEPIHFTGYSRAHDAWIFGEIAVHRGRVIPLSGERYFDIGRTAVKLRSEERLLSITYEPDQVDLTWIRDVWTAWGARGIVTLAFFTMSLFAVQIRARDTSLGFLELHGEPGSGKSTIVALMWKLFGRKEYEGFDPNKGTSAFIARSFQKVSNLPVGLIESGRDQDKSSHRTRFDWAELLTLFDGRSPRGTGRKTGGTETFEPPFLGSIYLMQNTPVDAMPAVLERIMSLRFDKSSWSEDSMGAALRLSRYPVEQASAYIVHAVRRAEAWLARYFARFDHHTGTLPEQVAERSQGKESLHNGRVIKNHAQLAAAVDTLAELFPENLLPPEWRQMAIQLIGRMAVERQLASGADHPIVQRFWDIVDDIQSREDVGDLELGTLINQSRKPESYFAISLAQFERKALHAGLRPPDPLELKRHLRGSRARKYLADKNVNCVDGKSRHCWVFENPARSVSLDD